MRTVESFSKGAASSRYVLLTVLLALLLQPASADEQVIYSNGFDNLEGLTLFGAPLPVLSDQTPDGEGASFDNNGDHYRDSGAVINGIVFDYTYGGRIEADVYVSSSPQGCWLDTKIAIAQNPAQADATSSPGSWLEFGLRFEGDSCGYTTPGSGRKGVFYCSYMGQQNPFRAEFDPALYNDQWVHLELQILADQTVVLWADGTEIYHSTGPIDLQYAGKQLWIGGRSSNYGHALIDNLQVYSEAVSAGKIQFASPIYSCWNDDGTVEISLLRTLGQNGPATVTYHSEDDTATAGMDYESVSGQVRFENGQASTRLYVPLVYDVNRPETKQFRLKLTHVDGDALLGPETQVNADVIIIGKWGPVLYVDAGAQANGNGLQWSTAYNDLQSALTRAKQEDWVKQIWVAQGTYRPSESLDRAASFCLVDGVAVYGGFAGGETSLAQRDWQANVTTLSGDLAGNDAGSLDDPSRDENSYSVVRCHQINADTILDGFTLAGGIADGTIDTQQVGGGLYNIESSPQVLNCTFMENYATAYGGGTFNYHYSDPLFVNCRYFGNVALFGGGMLNMRNCEPCLINCVFSGNAADLCGGGIASGDYSSLLMLNNTLAGNYADMLGGAFYLWGSSETRLTNSIVWGNDAWSAQEIYGEYADLLIWYSNIRDTGDSLYLIDGSLTDKFNIHTDPMLADADGVDDIVGTADDDLALRLGSPCIDAGTDEIDPRYGDLAFPSIDCQLHARRVDDPCMADAGCCLAPIIDMGAYEFGSYLVPARLHVNKSVTGGASTGIDWNNAIPELRDALTWAANSYGRVLEVWVAAGEYKPSSSVPPGYTCGCYDRSFELQDNLSIIGGFAGGETTLEQRNIALNPTELSGDLNGDDTATNPAGMVSDIARRNNSCHVVTAIDLVHSAHLDGLIIRDGHAAGDEVTQGYGGGLYCHNSNLKIRQCEFHVNFARTGGDAIGSFSSRLSLLGCDINSNCENSASFDHSDIVLLDEQAIASNDLWSGQDACLSGPGLLQIEQGGQCNFGDSQIRCDIGGTGTIKIDQEAELVLEHNALIDLSANGQDGGLIECDGLLVAKDDVVIRNTEVQVARARFEGQTNISNSTITAETGAPYGQFFVENTAQIIGNKIHADGDRYMDLDPSVFDGLLQDNAIYVTITEGVGQQRGGLFELRGQDNLIASSCPPDEFLCPMDPCVLPDFDPNSWTLEELRIVDDAKVNLTNRFDFQPPYDDGGEDEVLYVKKLILGKNSVLNTSFNRIYYGDLLSDPCAIVKNEPLLGFSLNNIACDDDGEFNTRVTHNNLEPGPFSASSYKRTHVLRVSGQLPDINGMIEMRNLVDQDPDSSTHGQVIHARAMALFAKSNEPEILVMFEYLFEPSTGLVDPCTGLPIDPDAKLAIYLTDADTLESPRNPDHYIEVDLLATPAEGRPGSPGSGRFGTFQKYVQTGNLNFIRGVRVELELIGNQNARVLINNWDPQVHCSNVCMDFTGGHEVNAYDFFTLLGEYGQSAAASSDDNTALRTCLDGYFCTDGRVDRYDLQNWYWSQLNGNLCNWVDPCSTSVQQASGLFCFADIQSASGLPSGLLIAGKHIFNAEPYVQDQLYVFDPAGDYVASVDQLHSHMNDRLIVDPGGKIYQVNLQHGLVSLTDPDDGIVPFEDANSVEPRYNQPATVTVGLLNVDGQWRGAPLKDAAFDGAGAVYVVPVIVTPQNPCYDSYAAAAKLRRSEGSLSSYQLERLFVDTTYYPNNDNPQRNAQREIELDAAGNVYVLNAHHLNESDVLWKFGPDGAKQAEKWLSDCPAPIALHVSDTRDRLYLTSTLNAPDANSCVLYGYALNDLSNSHQLTVHDISHVTDITSDPSSGTLYVSGIKMQDIPDAFGTTWPQFHAPRLASISYGATGDVTAQDLSDPNSHEMTLPLSMTWTQPLSCRLADIDGDTMVGLDDLQIMLGHWLRDDCIMPDWCGGADINRAFDDRGYVGLDDFAILSQYWLQSECF